MGGSGGYFSGSYDPEDLARKWREAELSSQDDTFDTKVNGYLNGQLARFNERDNVGIKAILDQIKKALETQIEETVDLLFGGSVDKHTYVNGLSDIDSLVLIKDSEAKDMSPTDLKQVLAETLRSRYGNDSVSEGNLAVTLTLKDNTIQLLPAIRTDMDYKISSGDGKKWSQIQPRKFAKALTKANQALGGKLVPTIKLLKACLATLPKQRQITGYHTESLAIKVFKNYQGLKTPKVLMRHFFEQASKYVKDPITDSSGQSVYVDEYLGASNSIKRRIVSDAFGRIARRMKNADGARSIQMWRSFLENSNN